MSYCVRCGRQITGKTLTDDTKTYHRQCFLSLEVQQVREYAVRHIRDDKIAEAIRVLDGLINMTSQPTPVPRLVRVK